MHEAPSRLPFLSRTLRCALLLLALAACEGCSGTSEPSDQDVIPIPARGTETTFDVGTWNLEWFGDPANGPDDDELQLRHVRDVLKGADLDLWGLEEVVSRSRFSSLVNALPGYAGLLANDPAVQDGVAYYSDFSDQEQKVALVYKASAVEVLAARVILTGESDAFAGRPPLEARVRVHVGGSTVEGVVIVLHAKSGADQASWERRGAAAAALKAYLDTTWPAARVWVIGDFNDDVDTSISSGRASPYAGFVGDAARWSFPTGALSAAGTTTIIGFPDAIDHQLVSDEASAGYVSGSVEAYRVDQHIPQYGATTTDHYPVLARYRIGS